MAKLFVLGDSFSFPYETEHKLWPSIVAENLSKKLNDNVTVVNKSLIGASQDYIWKNIDTILNEITPEDFLIIVLTSCDRFWYFENRPEYSNIMSIENVQEMAEDITLQNALVAFITRIWRPSLAMQHQNHRLGYLSYKITKLGLRKPMIIKGFEYVINNEEEFPDLNFSKHSLAKVQLEEFEKFEGGFIGADVLMDKKYWSHVDCRYNHLCLSNHKILGNIVSEGLYSNQSVDLSDNNFHKKIITEQNCKDKDFAVKELNIKFFNEMMSTSIRKKLGAKTFKLFF